MSSLLDESVHASNNAYRHIMTIMSTALSLVVGATERKPSSVRLIGLGGCTNLHDSEVGGGDSRQTGATIKVGRHQMRHPVAALRFYTKDYGHRSPRHRGPCVKPVGDYKLEAHVARAWHACFDMLIVL